MFFYTNLAAPIDVNLENGERVTGRGQAYTDDQIRRYVGHSEGSSTTRKVYTHILDPQQTGVLAGVRRLHSGDIAQAWQAALERHVALRRAEMEDVGGDRSSA